VAAEIADGEALRRGAVEQLGLGRPQVGQADGDVQAGGDPLDRVPVGQRADPLDQQVAPPPLAQPAGAHVPVVRVPADHLGEGELADRLGVQVGESLGVYGRPEPSASAWPRSSTRRRPP
jgi:hypothetical protein